MEPQIPPLDLGHTRGVQRRILESLPAVRAAKDFDPAFQEALRRMGQRLGYRLELVAGGESKISFVRATGLVIEQLGAEMVSADHALAHARKLQREACDRREAVRQETYRELSDFRDRARGILRPRRSKHVRCLSGETERDPHYLLSQVREVIGWATDSKKAPTGEGAGTDFSQLAAPLVTLRDALKAAIDAAVDAGIAAHAPLVARKKAIKTFDQEAQRGCRVLERTFEVMGLPTLAAAVRPHLKGTGRVGRPSKKRPVDQHPDLVAGLRAAGQLPQHTTPSAEAPKQPETTQKAAARRPRRRIVFGISNASPPAPSTRLRKARRPSAPEEQAGIAPRRRQRIVPRVSRPWPTGGATGPPVVRRPRAQGGDPAAAPLPPERQNQSEELRRPPDR